MKEKIINFFTDIIREMEKVTWPKQEELRESTLIVLTVCLIIAFFIFGVDTGVSEIYKWIIKVFRG